MLRGRVSKLTSLITGNVLPTPLEQVCYIIKNIILVPQKTLLKCRRIPHVLGPGFAWNI